ncbi:DUF2637 domain-containing protein [Sphaerimonospora thailandensis]|uniref:DUF2637 domain-containing protein n=1 Tax=Sphaerimonospora thailandensis TaxID=795644 RepID=A0A8J3R7T1_9ACTN|nr:DUF2637 domain-containing protein [Sphaerimonospora thailandensis]GIH69420.1 hypothetical protein Mth01_16730 [Sphaerimonospora thailandensis]
MSDLNDSDNSTPENTGSRRWRFPRLTIRLPRRTASAPAILPVSVRSTWAVLGVGVLGLLVLAIVAVGLHTALGPLRDTALAAHLEPEAAKLYWIGVDGLIVVAIIAAMILRHDRKARRYALGIVGLFTIASGVLQYLHGLGWTTPDRVSGVMPPLPWPVVVVVAGLVIGTVFCGTHLFVYVLRQLFPGSPSEQRGHAPGGEGGEASGAQGGTGPERPEQGGPLDPETEREIRKWFAAVAVGLLLENGVKPKRKTLATHFGISERQVGYVIADVERERDAAAERTAAQAAAKTTPINGQVPALTVPGSGVTP